MQSITQSENSLAVFKEISDLYSILEPFEQFEELKKPEYLVRNEGYKSFCNVAIWLTLYMMQNKAEQNRTVELLAEKSGKGKDEIQKAITELAKDETVINLIEKYGAKNFSIKIRSDVYQTLIECLQKNHNELFNFLTKETDILGESSSRKTTYLGLEMKKEVAFQWRDCGDPLETFKSQFENAEIQYLESEDFDYRLVEYNDNWWLIPEKAVYSRGCKEKTSVAGSFAIATPLIPGADNTQIRKVLQSTDIYKLYLVAKNSTEKLSDKGKDFIEKNLAQLKYFQKVHSRSPCFAESIKFPDLENKFIGTELKSAGQQTIFAPFCSIPINKKQPDGVAVKYAFKLKYDKYGGEILNKMGICCFDGVPRLKYTTYKITINQPYFALYEDKLQAQDIKDVFLFMIGDPIEKTITKITGGKIELIKQNPALFLSEVKDQFLEAASKLFK